MDLRTLLGKLDLIESSMNKAEKNPTGPKFNGQWKGTDAGTPGKKLVGDSVEPEESILKDLSKGPTPKTKEQELAEQFNQFLTQLEEENLGVADRRPARKGSRPARDMGRTGEPSKRYKPIKESVDDILTRFRIGWREISRSSFYSDEWRKTTETIYSYLRTPLMAGDVDEFHKWYNHLQAKYPDHFDDFLDASGIHSWDELQELLVLDESLSKEQRRANRELWDQVNRKGVVPSIDRERYTEIPGLEGPYRWKSGRVVYYDPREGKYYDRDRDMYLDNSEVMGESRPRVNEDEYYPPHDDGGRSVKQEQKWTEDDMWSLQNNLVDIDGLADHYIASLEYYPNDNKYGAIMKPYDPSTAKRRYVELNFDIDSGGSTHYPVDVEFDRLYGQSTYLGGFNDQEEFISETLSDGTSATSDIITKSAVKAALKEIDLKTIKAFTGNGTSKSLGKTGIALYSMSPMDATSAGRDRAAATVDKIRMLLGKLGAEVTPKGRGTSAYDTYTFNRGTRKQFTLVGLVSTFPTYLRSAGMDSGYQTYWYMFSDAVGENLVSETRGHEVIKTKLQDIERERNPQPAADDLTAREARAKAEYRKYVEKMKKKNPNYIPLYKVDEAGANNPPQQNTAMQTTTATPQQQQQAKNVAQGTQTLKTAIGSTASTDVLAKAIDTASQGTQIDAKSAQALEPMMNIVKQAAQDPNLANQFKTLAGQAKTSAAKKINR